MQVIRETGSIPACRISTAKLNSIPWKYWGIVRCVVKISTRRPRRLVVRPLEAASREYRSRDKAVREAQARYPDRVLLPPSHGLREESTLRILLAWVQARRELSNDLRAAIAAQEGVK